MRQFEGHVLDESLTTWKHDYHVTSA